MPRSLYIHIPFCNRICTYCDFNKVLIKNQPVDLYVDMLIKEFKAIQQNEFKTIFVGGGTPTALNEKQLIKLLDYIHTHFVCTHEFSFEANPDELTTEKINIMKHYGVNRLSLGVQSFNDRILEQLGRTHNNRDVFELVNHLQKINFKNYSLDLMYNLPLETMYDIYQSVDYIKQYHPAHVSWYSLIIEPHTVLFNRMRKNLLNIGSSVEEGEIYQTIIHSLNKLNYNQYEISNFSKGGYESEHNKTYWTNQEYYGVGAGSHGYVNGIRYENIKPVRHYIEAMKSNGNAIRSQHTVTKNEMIEEEMFLGLRMNHGVNIETFEHKHNTSLFEIYGETIHSLIEKDYLIIDNNQVKFTDKGRMNGNYVLSEFLL